jgi:hypothetical protein
MIGFERDKGSKSDTTEILSVICVEANIEYSKLLRGSPALNRVLGNAKEISDERGRYAKKDLSTSPPSKISEVPLPKKEVLLESNKLYAFAKWISGGVLILISGIAIVSLASKHGWFKGVIAEKTIEKVGKIANDSKMVQGLYRLCSTAATCFKGRNK